MKASKKMKNKVETIPALLKSIAKAVTWVANEIRTANLLKALEIGYDKKKRDISDDEWRDTIKEILAGNDDDKEGAEP